VLTKAIQEQQSQIEAQAKANDELRKQLQLQQSALKTQQDLQQKEIDELRELIKSIKK
jgi:flagellar biosynthesis chaperone FliJ